MIQELCHRLKEKRASLGYSIEYVVEETKLHPSVIRDIENYKLANLSPVYLKGFIKIYADFLGVDLGQALSEINSLNLQTKKTKTKIVRKVPAKRVSSGLLEKLAKISPELRKKIILVIAGLVLLWLVFVVGVKVVKGVSSIFKAKPKEVTSTIEDSLPAGTVIEAKELVVSLTVKRKCFIKVVVDGKLYFDGLLTKGARESWTGKKEIDLKISDGSAVYLEVNGKSIPALTSLRKPIKSLKITPSGISVDK